MSLLLDAPFSNLTIYRKDYTEKSCSKRPIIKWDADYKNPITGPYEEHILPYFRYKELPEEQTRYLHPIEYADQVAENYPRTRKFIKDPPGGPLDLPIIDKLYSTQNKTNYMISYCSPDYDSKREQERTRRTLPEGWVIPLTTQRCSYRDPTHLSPEGIGKIVIHRPKNNLTPNMKEREVLEVKTGESTYMADISNKGDEIIKGKLHGDVNVRPQFDQDELLRAKLIRTH